MARDPIGPDRPAAAWCCSIGLMVGLCVAAAAPPSAARQNHGDDCEMRLRRLCCSSQDVVLFLGCAPTQQIPLDLGPGHFEIFVDGERVPDNPSELALRTDESHVVLVKREGHVPKLVVLRTLSESGEPQLSPGRIRVRLQPRRVGRPGVTIRLVREGQGDEGLSAAGSE
jgi:hypothetical protein